MRRRRAEPRVILPDPKYNSAEVAKLVGKLMKKGKKSVALGLIYDAFDRVSAQTKRNPVVVLQEALRNTRPLLEVKPRRVGGATYQVPVEVRQNRSEAVAMRWILDGARARKGRPMGEKLAEEILAAARNEGTAVKKKEDLHKMAEANRAFAHYRW